MTRAVPPDHDEHRVWGPRHQAALLHDQITALNAWRGLRDPALAPPRPSGFGAREHRQDAGRVAAARERERRALLAALDRQLRAHGLPGGHRGPRVVLAHRDRWSRGALSSALEAEGCELVAALDDGADAVGTAVAEQPDVLLVEERLPTVPVEEVLQVCRALLPAAVLAVEARSGESTGRLLDAGAHAVVSRAVGPQGAARQVLQCLGAGSSAAGAPAQA